MHLEVILQTCVNHSMNLFFDTVLWSCLLRQRNQFATVQLPLQHIPDGQETAWMPVRMVCGRTVSDGWGAPVQLAHAYIPAIG